MMKPQPESGFALLLVLAMAASVALMLYMELPRLVFESQRVLEQDLVYRGEEYQRAIQLFVRKNRRYPTSLNELESTGNTRYLRRRYVDPMTGSEEWRLIHIDSAGFFTDSLLHDPPGEEEAGTTQNTFITEGPSFGSIEPLTGSEGTGAGANIQGASDRPVVTAEQFFGIPGGGGPGYLGAAQSEQADQSGGGQNLPPGFPLEIQPGQSPGATTPGLVNPALQPGFVPFGAQQTDPNAQAAQQQQGAPYAYPSIGIPGLPGPYGQLPSAQEQQQGYTGPQFTTPQQTPARSATTPSAAPSAAQASNPAMALIQGILTTPRPGGLTDLQQGQSSGQGLEGGIAGVASSLEVEGIMVYNERTKYNEWEFLYDYSADQTAAAGAAGQSGRGESGSEASRSGDESGFGFAGGDEGTGGRRGDGGGNRPGRESGGGPGGGRGAPGGGFGGFGGFGGGQGGQSPPIGLPPAPGGRGR